jgi:S1-C subfamily serine protease
LTTKDDNDSIAQVLASATPLPAYSALVYQVIRPSLVFIETEAADESGEEGHGVGSGVVINEAGDILTSLHVVANASDIQVYFADGTQSTAQVIAEQPESDIAVLQAEQLPELIVPAVLGSPNAMRVGDEAFVVGNPLGLYGSMSSGVISGFDRSFRPEDGEQRLEGLIQIDAAVNPGNSGGPLLNRYGQVVGIVAALANPTEQEVFIGIGFAVPITVAGGAAGLPPY